MMIDIIIEMTIIEIELALEEKKKKKMKGRDIKEEMINIIMNIMKI